jgi:hypothetical protein
MVGWSMVDELGRIWKEAVLAESRYYPSIRLERLNELRKSSVWTVFEQSTSGVRVRKVAATATYSGLHVNSQGSRKTELAATYRHWDSSISISALLLVVSSGCEHACKWTPTPAPYLTPLIPRFFPYLKYKSKWHTTPGNIIMSRCCRVIDWTAKNYAEITLDRPAVDMRTQQCHED